MMPTRIQRQTFFAFALYYLVMGAICGIFVLLDNRSSDIYIILPAAFGLWVLSLLIAKALINRLTDLEISIWTALKYFIALPFIIALVAWPSADVFITVAESKSLVNGSQTLASLVYLLQYSLLSVLIAYVSWNIFGILIHPGWILFLPATLWLAIAIPPESLSSSSAVVDVLQYVILSLVWIIISFLLHQGRKNTHKSV